ncbi:ParB/RepB/Spo0J family partition protein [Paracoccus sp. P2]|uniref:ParB/RepB/Spo0J family partition protein n=1 Tax=Paracoccus pantotrophus TaxID=82367 RepID=A0A7H9BXS1_PARPN|nr:ParB/RepB/Spo0J family partition protein [Paracoccus pantotrophus]QLH16220.1 ParB/RepB/Spo0J family partition protein [Paracoccus pantotrophus]RDE02006.1 ParB/RepB/Spo0J family partition protein [Paracoccus pantotrophus]RNI19301.1 ParB/RepB/Spo0J family partition protein [Paracoccus pantotrophus]WGR64246.1 ParB/RepB/Spo0J family partition protein [Paracoccus pantotrophus]
MAENKLEKRGLGRGLSALMADVDLIPSERPAPRQILPVEQLTPNPDQPRRSFAPEALQELADSLRTRGMLQPLIVRPHPSDRGLYQIVAGERRWRAAQIAQLHEVPVIVRDLDDTEVLEVAIVENIQRADLNAIEEAASYRQLMDRFGHTQEKLAEALNKSRSHIANLLRLLNLPEQVQAWLKEGKLTAGHARALITAANPVELARKVIEKNLSVRETEDLVRRQAEGARTQKPRNPRYEKDADTRALEGDLTAHLKMKVAINHAGVDGGQVVITYRDLDQLDRLCQILAGN